MSRELAANAGLTSVPLSPSCQDKVRLPLSAYPRYVHYNIIKGKHFLNSPSSLVVDSLKGLCTINSKVALDVQHKGIDQHSWQSSSWPVSPSCLSNASRYFKGCSHVWRGLWPWTCPCGFCRWDDGLSFLDQAYLSHFQAKACSRVWNKIPIPYLLLDYFIARCCMWQRICFPQRSAGYTWDWPYRQWRRVSFSSLVLFSNMYFERLPSTVIIVK